MTKNQAFLLGMCAGIGLLLLVGFAQRPQAGDATPADLRPGYREIYMDLVARAYATDSSLDLQMLLGEGWTPELSRTTLQALLDKTPMSAEGARARITRLAQALEVSIASPQPAARNNRTDLAFLLINTFSILALGLLGIILLNKVIKPVLMGLLNAVLGGVMGRKPYPSPAAPAHVREYKHAVPPTSWEGAATLPMLQFTTTYTLRDDRYDPSRSIETDRGEFLGECGVGMASAGKQGQSRLAPAFEVWMFDKSDIRTKTHVLLSDYVEQDAEARRRLVKDNPSSLVKPGLIVSLQTSALQLRAKVIDAAYLAHDQRSNCYFERLTVEIAVWQIQ